MADTINPDFQSSNSFQGGNSAGQNDPQNLTQMSEPTIISPQPNADSSLPGGPEVINSVPINTAVNQPINPQNTIAPQTPVNANINLEINSDTTSYQPPSGPLLAAPPNTPYIISAPPKSNKKILILIIVALLFLIITAVAYWFLIYSPNQPQNVYRKGLNQTGIAFDQLVKNSINSTNFDTYERFKTETEVNYDTKEGDVKFKGNINTRSDSTKTIGDINFTYQDQTIKANFYLDYSDSKKLLPKLFVKINGLAASQFGAMLPEFEKFENTWIDFSQWIDRYGQSQILKDEVKPDDQLNFADFKEYSQMVSGLLRQYVFTADTSKSIIKFQSFVASEKIEGDVEAYHYKVKLDKNRFQELCLDYADKSFATSLVKKFETVTFLEGEGLEAAKQRAQESCKDQLGKEWLDEDFDLWISKKYKLVAKFRKFDKQKPKNYSEFGFIYKGGDQVTAFIKSFNDQNKTTDEVAFNINTKNWNFSGDYKMTTADNKLNIKFATSALNEDLKDQAPKDAISYFDLLNTVGIDQDGLTPADSLVLGANTTLDQNALADLERNQDLQKIKNGLTTYYQKSGRYPSLQQVNNNTWRQINLPTLINSDTTDPSGWSYKFSSQPANWIYSYQATAYNNQSCDNIILRCSKITLTATKSDGQYLQLN